MFAAENAGGSSIGGIIGAIIFLGLVAALVVFIVLKLKGREAKPKTARTKTGKAQVEAMSPAERELHEAEGEYAAMVKQAEKQHQATIKEWDKRLSSSQKELQKASGLGQRKLGNYKSIKLLEDRVETPNGTILFESGQVNATVDTAGNLAVTKRITVTRLLAGGIVGGLVFQKKKDHDSRELYLLVESESVSSMVECDPDHGNKVRQFAVSINNASRGWAQLKASRDSAIDQASRQIAAITEQRVAGIRGSEEQLGQTRAYTGRIEAARAALPAPAPGPTAVP